MGNIYINGRILTYSQAHPIHKSVISKVSLGESSYQLVLWREDQSKTSNL